MVLTVVIPLAVVMARVMVVAELVVGVGVPL